MRPTFKLHFVVRNGREDADGLLPIYAKISLGNKVLMLAINHRIKAKEWDSKKEQPKANSQSYSIILETIEAFKSRVYQAYSKVIASGDVLSIQSFKNAINNKKPEVEKHTLIQTCIEHNQNFESLIGIRYSKGTYKNYKTLLKYLIEFVSQYCGKKDLALEKMNFRFCEAYFTYLTTQKTCLTNGAIKQIQALRKIVNYAIKHGYLIHNPIAGFNLKFEPVSREALTMGEINRLQKLNLQSENLLKVRDIFLLQCFTGLAYSDIKQLTVSNLQKDEKGEYWIRMRRQKTQTPFSVPLLSPAWDILKEYISNYKTGGPLLPVLSNQTMNKFLKIIQELAGISKNLTTHLGRHTFATTITLSNGVPIETVSQMLGHTKLSTTQLYAKVLDNKIAEDMNALKGKLDIKK